MGVAEVCRMNTTDPVGKLPVVLLEWNARSLDKFAYAGAFIVVGSKAVLKVLAAAALYNT